MSVKRARGLVLLSAIVAFLASCNGAYADGRCHLAPIGIVATAWDGPRPLAEVTVNGQRTRGLVDTGATTTAFFRDGAKLLGLVLHPTMDAFEGLGGRARAYVSEVRSLELGAWRSSNLTLFVIGSDWGGDHDVALTLGQDLLSTADIELDLAHNQIKLYRTTGDCSKLAMVYWADDWMEVELIRPTSAHREIRFEMQVNGQPVQAILDTGASTTFITRPAAERVGVKLGGPNTTHLGESTGIGPEPIDTWLGVFDTVSIGGETVRAARLRIGDIEELGNSVKPEILLGADFVRAHHIFVSYSQGKMYFTYSGGPIYASGSAQGAFTPDNPAK